MGRAHTAIPWHVDRTVLVETPLHPTPMSTRDDRPIAPNERPKDANDTTSHEGNADGDRSRNPDWTDRWPDVSKHLRQQHQDLTDADLKYSRGSEDDLFRRVGHRLGKTEQHARELVEQAARNQANNPQDRSMLKDQRDRTTGADQATRKDGPPAEGAARITNAEESERITNAPSSPYDPDKPRH